VPRRAAHLGAQARGVEGGQVADWLLPQRVGAQPGLPRGGGRGPDHAHRQAARGQGAPRVGDQERPGRRGADGVAPEQRHAPVHAVGHDAVALGREEIGAIGAEVEVVERVGPVTGDQRRDAPSLLRARRRGGRRPPLVDPSHVLAVQGYDHHRREDSTRPDRAGDSPTARTAARQTVLPSRPCSAGKRARGPGDAAYVDGHVSPQRGRRRTGDVAEPARSVCAPPPSSNTSSAASSKPSVAPTVTPPASSSPPPRSTATAAPRSVPRAGTSAGSTSHRCRPPPTILERVD